MRNFRAHEVKEKTPSLERFRTSPTAHMFGSSLAPLQSDGLLVVTVVVVVLVVVTVVVVVVLDVLVVLVVHESHRTGQSFRSASPANGRKH